MFAPLDRLGNKGSGLPLEELSLAERAARGLESTTAAGNRQNTPTTVDEALQLVIRKAKETPGYKDIIEADVLAATEVVKSAIVQRLMKARKEAKGGTSGYTDGRLLKHYQVEAASANATTESSRRGIRLGERAIVLDALLGAAVELGDAPADVAKKDRNLPKSWFRGIDFSSITTQIREKK